MTDDGRPYDVIIVGGGTSGSVVAARLSEDKSRRVLLLEAGKTFDSTDTFPRELLGLDESAWVGADHNWGHPVSLTRERPDSLTVTRGRVIGGSSSVNGGIHLRAIPEDFAGWGEGLWDWAEVLACYRASEHDLDFDTDPEHGDRGPVVVRRARRDEYTALYAAFDEACRSVGHPTCDDLNQSGAVGVGPLPRAYQRGTRMNAAFAYLFPALDRPNLEVLGDTLVRRILVSRGIVYGVESLESDRVVQRHAPLVVLCAGTFLTPAILLRSGIGPGAELAELGLDVLADLPGVGAALHDHPTVHVQVSPRSAKIIPPAGAAGRLQAALVFTSPGSRDRNDLQIMPAYRADRLALSVMLNRSLSAGSVRIVSADPSTSPHIQLDYLSRPEDVVRLRAGVREAVRLISDSALSEISACDGADELPRDLDDDELDEWIRRTVSTAAHSTGTCAIGDPDRNGVVDARGRVHGVEGLAVADISVVPVPLRNNTNATSLMIGERFAQLIDGANAAAQDKSRVAK